MSSLIRTIRCALERQSVETRVAKVAAAKPHPKRRREKGGRAADDYRSARRHDGVVAARKQRKLIRASLKARPLSVELPREDGKNRQRECARRLRQIAKAAA